MDCRNPEAAGILPFIMHKKRLPPPIKPADADIGAALLSGDAFFRLAQQFISHAAASMDAAQAHAAANFGELIASATNLALAIEIYTKALLLLNGRHAPKLHELPALFLKLPAASRRNIEAAYDQLSANAAHVPASLSIHVAKHGDPAPDFNEQAKPQDHSLMAVLQRGSNAFTTWRYLFAHGTTSSGAPLTYEFLRLTFAAQAIRQQFDPVTISLWHSG